MLRPWKAQVACTSGRRAVHALQLVHAQPRLCPPATLRCRASSGRACHALDNALQRGQDHPAARKRWQRAGGGSDPLGCRPAACPLPLFSRCVTSPLPELNYVRGGRLAGTATPPRCARRCEAGRPPAVAGGCRGSAGEHAGPAAAAVSCRWCRRRPLPLPPPAAPAASSMQQQQHQLTKRTRAAGPYRQQAALFKGACAAPPACRHASALPQCSTACRCRWSQGARMPHSRKRTPATGSRLHSSPAAPYHRWRRMRWRAPGPGERCRTRPPCVSLPVQLFGGAGEAQAARLKKRRILWAPPPRALQAAQRFFSSPSSTLEPNGPMTCCGSPPRPAIPACRPQRRAVSSQPPIVHFQRPIRPPAVHRHEGEAPAPARAAAGGGAEPPSDAQTAQQSLLGPGRPAGPPVALALDLRFTDAGGAARRAAAPPTAAPARALEAAFLAHHAASKLGIVCRFALYRACALAFLAARCAARPRGGAPAARR